MRPGKNKHWIKCTGIEEKGKGSLNTRYVGIVLANILLLGDEFALIKYYDNSVMGVSQWNVPV